MSEVRLRLFVFHSATWSSTKSSVFFLGLVALEFHVRGRVYTNTGGSGNLHVIEMSVKEEDRTACTAIPVHKIGCLLAVEALI